jgi:hypothetical protein
MATERRYHKRKRKPSRADLRRLNPVTFCLPCGKLVTIIPAPENGKPGIDMVDPPGCRVVPTNPRNR